MSGLLIPTLTAIDLCERSYTQYTVGEENGCRCLVTALDGSAISEAPRAFTFMGTKPTSWRDWARDAEGARWHDPVVGDVHLGLWFSLCRTSWRLAPLFRAGDAILGHSAGGAYAHGFAAQMGSLGLDAGQVTTLEACRMGTGLARWLDRYPGDDWANGEDDVVCLPTWASAGRTVGYRHIGRPVRPFVDILFVSEWAPDHELGAVRASYVAEGCPV